MQFCVPRGSEFTRKLRALTSIVKVTNLADLNDLVVIDAMFFHLCMYKLDTVDVLTRSPLTPQLHERPRVWQLPLHPA